MYQISEDKLNDMAKFLGEVPFKYASPLLSVLQSLEKSGQPAEKPVEAVQ